MIEQVLIENYKSIKDLSLPLNRLNVLIGSNGAGNKTAKKLQEQQEHCKNSRKYFFAVLSILNHTSIFPQSFTQ